MIPFNEMKLWIFLIAIGSGVGLGLLGATNLETSKFEAFQSSLKAVNVVHPERPPVPSQGDLEIALALFSVDVPTQVAPIRFDPELEDRGLTTGTTFGGATEVLIGPAAFSSWGILGSTLGHEIEVHVKQNFLNIVLRDELSNLMQPLSRMPWEWETAVASDERQKLFGASRADKFSQEEGEGSFWSGHISCTSCGTWKAEREAYEYELSQAERFGLSANEVELIRQVMETYYPSH